VVGVTSSPIPVLRRQATPQALPLPQPVRRRFDNVRDLVSEDTDEPLDVGWADARIIPDEKYFSMPSTGSGATSAGSGP
jgi:hypothetical protein